ncbi:MAG: histidinol-phosphate transaminase [Proteobacteria bacterium]|nr:histidinol-phosphate transaminase [Pseudomonadota bacterium]
MSQVERLIREDLQDITAYSLARQPSQQQIWLDMNELPWENHPIEPNLNRYPSDYPKALLQTLAAYYQVKPSELCLTRGSSDGIDLLMRLFCRPYQDSVAICPPTFGMYAIWAKIQGIRVLEVPLLQKEDFIWDVETIKKTKAKLVFICSPNNPSGTVIPEVALINLCQALENKALVVVDEAYIEFAAENSMACYLNQCENLVVLRTFSKAFGLAGIRLGIVLANATILQYLKAILPPFAVPYPTLTIALKALQQGYTTQVKETISHIQNERSRLQAKLSALPFVKKVWPSQANFLLIQVDDAQGIYERCLKQGVIIRKINCAYLKESLRLTIGQEAQNTKLLKILSE